MNCTRAGYRTGPRRHSGRPSPALQNQGGSSIFWMCLAVSPNFNIAKIGAHSAASSYVAHYQPLRVLDNPATGMARLLHADLRQESLLPQGGAARQRALSAGLPDVSRTTIPGFPQRCSLRHANRGTIISVHRTKNYKNGCSTPFPGCSVPTWRSQCDFPLSRT